MNRCQMSNNNINSSAPSTPAGTIADNDLIDPRNIAHQQPKLSRSRSLSDISQDDSPGQDDQQQLHKTQQQEQQQPKPQLPTETNLTDGLKVKIKTINNLNNNNSKSDTTVEKESSSNLTTITTTINPPINISYSFQQSIEGTSNKIDNDSNNITPKSRTTINGANNSLAADKASNDSSNSSMSASVTEKPVNIEVNMNNHGASNSTAEKVKSLAPTQQLQIPFAQPTQSTQQIPLSAPPQPQQQNTNLSPQPPQGTVPPLAEGLSSTKTTPQKSPTTTQKSTTPESKKSLATTASPIEPKPKTTRTRKQPAASNKGANATPKPTPKPRSKKAKQNADNAVVTLVTPTQPQVISSALATTASTIDNKNPANLQQPPVPQTKKRKPRGSAANSAAVASTAAASASKIDTNAPAASPPKRTRKKKGDIAPSLTDKNNNPPPHQLPPHPMIATNITLPPLNITNPQLLSVASNVPMGHSPIMSNAPLPSLQQPNINRQIPNMPLDAHDPARYYQLTISPYANYDHNNAASLTRPSLSRLFTSSAASSDPAINSNSHSEELAKAFDDLRDNTWTNLSKCILDQASQFDIPSLIGTLYHLRQENDKLVSKVRDLTQKRDQLIAMNARLELPDTRLIPHLNHTSPNFSAVVGLTNSPRTLPNSSPSPAMNKSPIVPGSSYNVQTANSLGPPGFIDRSSPLVGLPTPHSGVNSLKTSTMSTPSPPTSAMMAHVANNRAGLMSVNPPYMPNVHPSINAMNPHGCPNPPGSSYYPRQ